MKQSAPPPIDLDSSRQSPVADQYDGPDLHSLYRLGSDAEPGPALDALILEAAHAEIASESKLSAERTSSQRKPTWWWRWLPATSAIAVAILGLSITLRMVDEGGLKSGAALGEAEAPLATSSAMLAAPAAAPGNVQPSLAKKQGSAEPGDQVADANTADVRPAPAKSRSEQATKAVPSAPDRMRQKTAAPEAARIEAPTPQFLAEDRSINAASAGAVGDALEAVAPGVAKPGAPRLPQESISSGGAIQADEEALAPENWLARIRVLRTTGRTEEAQQSLARFRQRFPSYVLPEEFSDLK